LARLNTDRFQILDRYERVAPFIQAANDASDNNRDFLGFLPRSLFDEYARRNDLFVLAAMDGADLKYAGHLLFDRKHPRTKVLQLFIASEYRGCKCARLLVEHLVKMLTREGFTSIYARVGEDMSEANERWGALGFRVQRTEPGGVTTGRMIVVRVRELESPQLFPTRVMDPADPLGIIRTPTTEVPLFLIDLNVLFDLSPQRKRHEEAILLFKAERADFCKLAISDELLAELARSATPGRPDSMMDLARTFSTFPVSKAKPGDAVFDELHRLVFPQKTAGGLIANDVSDLRHLITAIENGLAGLVTNDQASLRASASIEARFHIQVISPKAFMPPESVGLVATAFETSTANLALTPMAQSDEPEVRALSGSSNFQQLKRGTLILFYESKHPRSRGELVAIGRVRRSYLKEVSALDDSDLGQSVLTPDTLPEIGSATLKTVTVFDNLFRLPSPISLDRLQDLGCGRPNDLITTRPISDTQLQAILAEAFEIHER
jgi:GNAT superfamily N-acetyltransferase